MRTSIIPTIVLCLTTALTAASVISDLSSAASITSRISSALHGANSSSSASSTGAGGQPSPTSGSSTSHGLLGSATSVARSRHTKNAGVPELRIPGMGVEGAVAAGGLVAALFM